MDVRKNIYSLTDTELTNFVAAVKAAKEDGKYDDFIRRHQMAMMDPTPMPPEISDPNNRNVAHRGPAFLPWHRYFIREFELILQSEVAGVTLPYWDWAADAALANPVQAPLWNSGAQARVYIGGDGIPPSNSVTTGPFDGWTALIASTGGNFVPRQGGLLRLLGRDPQGSPTLPRQNQVDAAIGMPDYDTAPWNKFSTGSFRNRLEGWLSLPGDDPGPQLHNRVHTWVGGDMLPGTSPNDPVFFLNHCNIDRLWAQWQHANSSASQYLPTSGGPAGHNLNDVLTHLTTTSPSPTPANAIEYQTNLGYRYDTDPVPATSFIIDRSTYGQDEVDALRTQPGGAVVRSAFYVIVDGFAPNDLGIVDSTSLSVAPFVPFTPSTGVTITPSSLTSNNPDFPAGVVQRFRFGYDVDFGSNDDAFAFTGDSESVTLTTSVRGLSASAQVLFIKQPDPYILQGQQTWWLSTDIRLIQVPEGGGKFGKTMGNDPFQFLSDVTAALEAGQGTAGGQSFDTNTQEDDEVISVAPKNAEGKNVYNFAIARVHYRGAALPAAHVRVFFRLFAANSTGTAFDPASTFARFPAAYPVPSLQFGQSTIPIPGIVAGEYVSVPCFGSPRQSAVQAGSPNSLPALQQSDSFNDRMIVATGGPLHDTFYGCWLDINQMTPVLPPSPPSGNEQGPWPPGAGITVLSLRQAFIQNEHTCIVAEVAFDPDSINAGTQPWNSDKFAQRNLSWSYAANPGVVASRLALEPFEVRPTPASVGDGEMPDELMIDWMNVPVGQSAEICLPSVDADALLRTAAVLYPSTRLTRVDAHTIGCTTGGVTYIPLPKGSLDGANFAGLMSVSLPEGIRKGQLFTALVRQLTNAGSPKVSQNTIEVAAPSSASNQAGIPAAIVLTVDSSSGQDISGISFNPNPVTGGSPCIGTVSLAAAASAGGVLVNLISASVVVASVPASITIPAGASSGTFAVTTTPVNETTAAEITATSINSVKEMLTINAAGAPEFAWRQVLGTFQVNMPVSTKELLVGREEQRLSIFRWLAEGKPANSRWFPVSQRYIDQISKRVRALGGDPDIGASPDGKPLCWNGRNPGALDDIVGKVVAILPDGTEYRQVLGNPAVREIHITANGCRWIAVQEEVVEGKVFTTPFTIHWRLDI